MFEALRRAGKERLLETYPALFWQYMQIRYGGYIEEEMALLPRLCRPDQLSIDVGANYGSYSFQMMKLSRAVWAFEPLPRCAAVLRKGLRGNVQVFEVALSDRVGTASLRAPEAQTGRSTIEPSNPLDDELRARSRVVEVAVKRLDDYRPGSVGFIKIDVEGHEQEVLRGAEQTLAASQPALLLEVEERHRAGSVAGVAELLERHGYRGFFLRGGRLHDFQSFDADRDQSAARPDAYVRNFLFLPPQRVAAFGAELR